MDSEYGKEVGGVRLVDWESIVAVPFVELDTVNRKALQANQTLKCSGEVSTIRVLCCAIVRKLALENYTDDRVLTILSLVPVQKAINDVTSITRAIRFFVDDLYIHRPYVGTRLPLCSMFGPLDDWACDKIWNAEKALSAYLKEVDPMSKRLSKGITYSDIRFPRFSVTESTEWSTRVVLIDTSARMKLQWQGMTHIETAINWLNFLTYDYTKRETYYMEFPWTDPPLDNPKEFKIYAYNTEHGLRQGLPHPSSCVGQFGLVPMLTELRKSPSMIQERVVRLLVLFAGVPSDDPGILHEIIDTIRLEARTFSISLVPMTQNEQVLRCMHDVVLRMPHIVDCVTREDE
jgi:hypothetical protein